MKTRTNQPIELMSTQDIEHLSDSFLNELKCGDIITKQTGEMKHTYVVTYKQEKHGICLSYFACGYLETISYDYTDGHWVFNSKDVCEVPQSIYDILDPYNFIKLSYDEDENLLIELPCFLKIVYLELSSIVLEDDTQVNVKIEFDNTNGYQVISPFEIAGIDTNEKTKVYYIWMKQNVKSLDSVGIDNVQCVISTEETL